MRRAFQSLTHRLLIYTAVVMTAIVLAAGCGPTVVNIGGTPRKKLYRSFVSLSPSTTELIFATQQAQGRLKGRTAYDNWPKIQVNSIPIVASVKPDYEKIAGIRPELVAYDKDLYNASDIEKIKALGGDPFVLEANTIDGFVDQLYSLASMIGGETYISDYVDKINIARTASADIKNHPKVAILIPGNGGAHMIAGTESFVADVVRAAGGDPIGPKGSLFVPMNDEFLLTQNPDYIVTAGPPDAVLSDPRLKSLSAISKRQIVPVLQDILLRRGSRVDQEITAIHDAIAKQGSN